MLIKQDASDKLFYTEFKNESKHMQNLEEEGTKRYFAFNDIANDIFTMMFETKFEAEEGQIPVGLRIAKQNLDKLQELREWSDLKRLTNLDVFASGLATQAMSKQFINLLPKVSEDTEELKNRKIVAEELGLNDIAIECQNKVDDIGKYLEKVDPYVLDDEKCRQKMREALQEAIKETSDALEGLDGFGCSDEPGIMKQINLREKMEMAKRLKDSKKLKEISILAGRFVRIARKKQKEKMASSTMSGIEFGNDLNHILPSELGKLGSQLLTPLFYKSFSERTLLQYSLHNKVAKGQGDIIVCIDTSGSTLDGHIEIAEKAIAMALLDIAKAQSRGFVLINFSSSDQIRVFEAPKGKCDTLQMLCEMEHAWGGGTSFSSPLGTAIKYIEANKYNKADIIFITDGRANLTPAFLTNWNKLKTERQFSCIGVLVGKEAGVLQSFSDELFKVDDLLSGESNNANFQERAFKI